MRPTLLSAVALAAALSFCAAAQAADEWPRATVRIVVPFAAGGTSDILSRTIGQKLSEVWGKSVITDNKPGAGGAIGADIVAKAPADGHTLYMSEISTLTISPLLYPKLPFDPVKDIQPITMVAVSPHILAIHPSVPAKTLPEFVAYVKANPKKLNFASAGTGTYSHLASEHLRGLLGAQWVHVPYKGGAAALNGMVGGDAQAILNGALATVPFVKGGTLVGLAVAHGKRFEGMPDLPTTAEGGVPFQSGSWQGLFTTGGTSAAIVEKIQKDVVAVLRTPEIRDRFISQGAEPSWSTPQEFTAFLAEDTAKWAKVIKENDIKME
jgi:tripartite-type tricarboxylate transporter receptor subunit TctC